MTELSEVCSQRSRAQSHRCSAAVLRHTKSLSHHFALLPRIHRGPVSVLAGYSALFISAPGPYLLSPGSQTKCFFFLMVRPWQVLSGYRWTSQDFFFPSSFSQSSISLAASLCYIGRNAISILLRGSIENHRSIIQLGPALFHLCEHPHWGWDLPSFYIYIFHEVQIK